VQPVLGMGEAARYALEVGMERGGVGREELATTLRGKTGRAERNSRARPRQRTGGYRNDRGERWDATELSKLLRTTGINTSASLARLRGDRYGREKRGRPRLAALSPHYYNTEEEIDPRGGTCAP